jgi:hypothetical protein
MVIDRKYRPEIACSTNESRYNLIHCCLDRDDKGARLVSTDGAMMAVIPVEMGDDDEPGLVSATAIVAARKAGTKSLPVVLYVNGSQVLLDGTSFPRPDKSIDFPDWRKVIPEPNESDPDTIAFGIDVGILARAAKAIGSPHLRIVVRRELAPPHGRSAGKKIVDGPILVTAKGGGAAFAVVMPIRID